MQNAMTHTAVCGYLMGLYASMTQSRRMKFNTFAMSTTHCFQCGKIAPEFVSLQQSNNIAPAIPCYSSSGKYITLSKSSDLLLECGKVIVIIIHCIFLQPP